MTCEKEEWRKKKKLPGTTPRLFSPDLPFVVVFFKNRYNAREKRKTRKKKNQKHEPLLSRTCFQTRILFRAANAHAKEEGPVRTMNDDADDAVAGKDQKKKKKKPRRTFRMFAKVIGRAFGGKNREEAKREEDSAKPSPTARDDDDADNGDGDGAANDTAPAPTMNADDSKLRVGTSRQSKINFLPSSNISCFTYPSSSFITSTICPRICLTPKGRAI